MRSALCRKLHGPASQVLFALHQSSDPIARHWSRVAIFAYPTRIRLPRLRVSRRNIAMTFGVETRVVWILDDEKNLKMCLFVSTESTNVTDGRSDSHRMTA